MGQLDPAVEAQRAPRKTALAWLVGAAITGLVVGVVAELLVGEASGGGVPGATSMAVDTGLATVVALIAVAIVVVRPGARTAVVVVTVVLAVVALVLAWYSPMALVLGATAFGLSGARHRGRAGVSSTRAGTAGGAIAALWLVVFIGIVAAELLRG